jgi:hypothetical protein
MFHKLGTAMNFRPFASAYQLASDIRLKKISCLELLNAYLKRVERFNPALNAIVVTDTDRARKQARAADRCGPRRARRALSLRAATVSRPSPWGRLRHRPGRGTLQRGRGPLEHLTRGTDGRADPRPLDRGLR